jgi:sterol desaturase/sphingolipid hydroxylase (fatty acid hydroxylase superfamily)
MPTPIEILLDPISLIVIALYFALFAWESIFPGRELPRMKYWKIRGIGFFAFYFYLSSYLPLIWDKYLVEYQLMDLSGLGVLGGGILGILLFEFGVYVWHYAMHKNNTLWKIFHQMHHSTERIDIPYAFIFSPMDMIGWTFLGSLCFALIMGLSPQANTFVLLTTTFMGVFQHANIKTPHWLGYIIQRPESHTVHHAKNVHAYNYSDLPIYDILFGTFKNPKTFDKETGFYKGASYRLKEMLLFKDVSEPKKVLEHE